MTEHDVVVLGTGAAGLVAALAAAEAGASVGLYERADVVGGTTALSGAIVWVPNNHHMVEHGLSDSFEEALEYVCSLSFGLIDPDLAAAFVESAAEAVEFVESASPLRFHVVEEYPDYHSDRPGGKPKGGRSLDPGLVCFDDLGEWAGRVVHGPENYRYQAEEARAKGATVPADELADREARDVRGRGQALAGGLLKGCLDAGVAPVLGARAVELVLEAGRVAGVRFEDGSEVRARRGVVIATGGFEWDEQLVRAFLRGPMTAAVGIPTNTGDGLRMAQRAGALLGNMREAWWVPVVEIPGDELLGQPRHYLLLGERHLPGSIMVNGRGRRFTNEATNYNALGGAFHQIDVTRFEYANLPAWFVFDGRYFREYGFAGLRPGSEAPAWLHGGASLSELAESIGVPADALAATVERWNAQCETGVDADHGRGENPYDLWYGDQRWTGTPRSVLGPLDEPPFFAVEVHSGALGTKGGPQTDRDARVLDLGGEPIPGLYAAGNAMASVTGMSYAGGGGTLGPAMAFGYRAGRHAALSE